MVRAGLDHQDTIVRNSAKPLPMPGLGVNEKRFIEVAICQPKPVEEGGASRGIEIAQDAGGADATNRELRVRHVVVFSPHLPAVRVPNQVVRQPLQPHDHKENRVHLNNAESTHLSVAALGRLGAHVEIAEQVLQLLVLHVA